VFCFVMLMASGHSASYAAHPATVVAGTLALTLPIMIHFGLQADRFHGVLAIAAVLYLLALFRSLEALSYFFGRTHRLAHELQEEKARVEILARSDFLTSLNNRRAFYESGEKELRYAQRYGHTTCLTMLDIDHFKSINDRFGHAAGDAVLRAVAALIREQLRSTDIAGRLGGEEFAVLLPEVTLDLAHEIAERLRAAIEQKEVEHVPAPIRLTASLGVVEIGNGESLEQAIARADAALYAAKHAGRNRVVVTAPVRIPATMP
jgi:diguanylate cyclase (GGDEF)-like protein